MNAIKEANARCDRHIPLLKLLKAWNSVILKKKHGKKPFKSFHLEVMSYSGKFELQKDDNNRAKFAKLLAHLAIQI